MVSMDPASLNLRSDVLAASAGDREAFARLVNGHSNLVSAIALAEVRDRRASEDVAQDVFLHAWVGLRSLRNPDSFLPWLREITRNRARRALRTRRHEKILDAAEMAAIPDAQAAVSEVLAKREEERLLSEALERIPDDAREALTLFYREGCSTQQVARLLDLSDEAVRKRVSRARLAVKEELEKSFGDIARKTAPGAAFTASVLVGLDHVPMGLPTSSSWTRIGFASTGLLALAVVLAALVLATSEKSAAVARTQSAATEPEAGEVSPTLPRPPAPAAEAAIAQRPSEAAAAPTAPPKIEGEVLRADGTAAANAEVFALGETTLKTTTDARGAFSFRAPAGNYSVIARLGLQTGALAEPIHLVERSPARKVVIRLAVAPRLEGKVIAAVGGTPVPGAAVTLVGPDGVVLASGPADAKGEFVLESTFPAQLDLVTVAEGYATLIRRRLHLDNTQPARLVIELDREAILEGTLKDASGKSVAGGLVYVRIPRGGGPRPGDKQTQAVTAADGTFRFTGLGKGDARISATFGALNAPTRLIELAAGAVAHIEVQVFENALVSGTVRTADGKPTSAKILVRAAPKLMSEETGMMPRFDDLRADGTYELTLLPGDYLLGAFVEGAAQDLPTSLRLTVGPGERATRDLVLGALIEGTVVDPSGAPVAGAVVTIQAPRVEGKRPCFSFQGRSDDRGTVLFPRPACSAVFDARAMNGGQVVEALGRSSAVSDVRLQMQRPGSVSGRVLGAQAGGFKVRLARSPFVLREDDWLEFTGTTFELRDAPAGTFDVVCQTTDGLVGSGTVTLAPGGHAALTIDVAKPASP